MANQLKRKRVSRVTEDEVLLQPLPEDDKILLEQVRVDCFPRDIPKKNDLKGMNNPKDGISSNFNLKHARTNKMIAFVTADFNKLKNGKSYIQFDNVCTLQAWRGRGVQTLLLRLVRDWYRKHHRRSGIYSFNIRIKASKKTLLNFYTAPNRGFKEYKRLVQGKDVIVFTRDLF